jgi:hypothetical protein
MKNILDLIKELNNDGDFIVLKKPVDPNKPISYEKLLER